MDALYLKTFTWKWCVCVCAFKSWHMQITKSGEFSDFVKFMSWVHATPLFKSRVRSVQVWIFGQVVKMNIFLALIRQIRFNWRKNCKMLFMLCNGNLNLDVTAFFFIKFLPIQLLYFIQRAPFIQKQFGMCLSQHGRNSNYEKI